MKTAGFTNKGFTIIEIISVIVISGIIAIGTVGYISRSAESLNTSANINQLAVTGRIAVDRLAMEIHNSLPNSIRVTTADVLTGDQCIEFVPVRAATTYIDPPFGGAGGTTFDVADFVPSQEGETGGYAVIYPNRINQIYDGENATATGFPFRGPIEEIDDIQDTSPSSDASEVTLVSSHRFRRRSPNERFFVVEQPISYCVSGDKLYRYSNYGFYDNQPEDEDDGGGTCDPGATTSCLPSYADAPDKVLIVDSIDNAGISAFTVGSQSLRRNSLVSLLFNFSANGESFDLSHEVLTRSVP